MYIASVVAFHAQLTPVPPAFEVAEREAVVRLFPGPTAWATPAALKDLKPNFSAEWADVAIIARASPPRARRSRACSTVRENKLTSLPESIGQLTALQHLCASALLSLAAAVT